MAVVAAALAWIVPGAGHVYLRRPVRGAIIFVMIGATFWTGIALGGVMTVDPEIEPWWFAANLLTGVHGLASWQHEQRVYDGVVADLMRQSRLPSESASRGQSVVRREMIDKVLAERKLALVPPVDTAARAYAGVAGLINLLCIFDAAMLALMGRAGEPPRPPPEEEDKP